MMYPKPAPHNGLYPPSVPPGSSVYTPYPGKMTRQNRSAALQLQQARANREQSYVAS